MRRACTMSRRAGCRSRRSAGGGRRRRLPSRRSSCGTSWSTDLSLFSYAEIQRMLPHRYPMLIVESFSQAGAILWKQSAGRGGSDDVLMFGVARDCEFEHDVFPGDSMQHRVRLERALGDSLFLSGETWVGDRRIARFGWLVAVTRPASAMAR